MTKKARYFSVRAAAMSCAALFPITAQAATLAAVPEGQRGAMESLNQAISPEQAIHQRIELYGALRFSVDYADSDVSKSEADTSSLLSDGDVSVSSNTSMIGFRGMIPVNDRYRAIWQYEQQVDLDDTDAGDVWTTRDSFLGLDSPYGVFLIGRVNTPFKNMGVAYLGYFNTTVGDSHAILGAASNSTGRLDLLGSNALTWRYSSGRLSMQAQFAADQAGSIRQVDDNDRASYSAWVRWRPGPLDLNAAWIKYAEYGGIDEVEAYRASAKYSVGGVTVGALYENIDTDGATLVGLDRPAYGVQLEYNILPRWTTVAQWNHAEESDIGNDEADQYSAALFHSINRQLLVYVAYTMTRNDGNAAYRGVDYAHGDHLGTLPGRNPQAISVGAQLKF